MSPEGRETVTGNGRPRRPINLRGIARLVAIIATGALIVLAATLAAADPASPLAVTKTDSVDPVASGQELTYSITTVNTGGAKVNKVILTDQVNHLAGVGTPPKLVLTSTKGSCSQSFFQTYYLVSCSAGSLAGGESWTVTIRGVVTAPDGTTINNTASVTATKTAQNFTTIASATTLVQNASPSPLADLTVTKAGPSSVAVSSPLLYSLTVNNIGAANATDIKVIDTLPAGVDFVSASGNSLFVCSSSGGPVPTPFTVTCTGGRVNAGSNATIIIGAVSPAAPGIIENTAVVDPDQTVVESNDLNNTSAAIGTTVTATPATPQLAITKTDSPDPVTPGGTLEYTIVVTNTGAGPQSRANDVLVVDGTQGLDAASITATAFVNGIPGNCIVIAPQVSCEPPDPGNRLEGGETMTVTITGTVVASAGTTLINTATVTGNIQNQGVSNTATAITEVRPGVDLSITKADDPDPVCARSWPDDPPAAPPGASDLQVCEGGLKYTFVVGNSGIFTATGVLVRDALPPGLVFDSFTAPDFAGGCSVVGANVVECTGGVIGPESTSTIMIVLVAPPDTGFIANTVKVDPNNAIFEADETNNEFTITTQVKTGIDLTIFKYDEPTDPVNPDPEGPYDPVTEGFDPIATSGTQTYTVIVDNIGTQDAANIRVRDFLPAGTTFLSARGDNGFQCSYVGEGHYVECVQGAIRGTASEVYFGDGADDARITIKLFAQPTVTAAMHNEAKVDPLHEIAETNENNNVTTEDTVVTIGDYTIGAFNELSITKDDGDGIDPIVPPAGPPPGPSPVTPGGLFNYTLRVENKGTDPAMHVTVRDFLPADVEYVIAADTTDFASSVGDFTCSASGNEETGAVVECINGTLDGVGDQLGAGFPTVRFITIQVVAPDQHARTLRNQAKVDPDNAIPEGDETNNQATETTGVLSRINLTIKKSGPPEAQQSQEKEYVLTVRNCVDVNETATEPCVDEAGTAPAFGVEVHDKLPVGMIVLGASIVPETSNFSCQVQENPVNVVDCVGDLAGGETIMIKIKVFITASDGTVLDNEACVDPDNKIVESDEPGPGPFERECSTASTTVGTIDLTINKADEPDSVTFGEELVYTLTASNNGTQAANGVLVRDDLPDGLDFVSAIGTNGFTCGETAPGSNIAECTGNLAGGNSTVITITTTVTGPTEDGAGANSCTDGLDNGPDGFTDAADPECFAEFSNTAVVDPDNTIAESDETNNQATETTSVGSSAFDLVLASFTDTPDPVTPGQTLEYTVVALNTGSATATGVEVLIEDVEPAGVDFVGAAGSNAFACSFSDPDVTCTGNLPSGGFTIITIQVMILSAPPFSLSSTATVDPGNAFIEFNETNNSLTEPTTVTTSICSSCIDLVMGSILGTPDPVAPGGTLTYIVTAGNAGDISTLSVGPNMALVRIYLDADLTLVSATAEFDSDAFNDCELNVFLSLFLGQPVVDCSGDLNAGQGVVITIDATVGATEDGGGAGSCADNVDNGPDGFTDGDDPDCILFTQAEIDPADALPAGTGATDEFTNANNGPVSEVTIVDVP